MGCLGEKEMKTHTKNLEKRNGKREKRLEGV